MVSRTLEERLAKAKKAVRDTRWWVVLFKYGIVAALLFFMDDILNIIDYLLIVNSEPRSIFFFIQRVHYILWSIILIALIRWMF